jgi:hypothetical protein
VTTRGSDLPSVAPDPRIDEITLRAGGYHGVCLDSGRLQTRGIGHGEHIASRDLRAIGSRFVRLVARAVAADVDDDEDVIATSFRSDLP